MPRFQLQLERRQSLLLKISTWSVDSGGQLELGQVCCTPGLSSSLFLRQRVATSNLVLAAVAPDLLHAGRFGYW